MDTMTSTVTKAVTNTKLAIATLAMLVAGGAAALIGAPVISCIDQDAKYFGDPSSFLVKSTTTLGSVSKTDRCVVYPTKTYLFEGSCYNGKLVEIQKNCAELNLGKVSTNYQCVDGACKNMAPVSYPLYLTNNYYPGQVQVLSSGENRVGAYTFTYPTTSTSANLKDVTFTVSYNGVATGGWYLMDDSGTKWMGSLSDTVSNTAKAVFSGLNIPFNGNKTLYLYTFLTFGKASGVLSTSINNKIDINAVDMASGNKLDIATALPLMGGTVSNVASQQATLNIQQNKTVLGGSITSGNNVLLGAFNLKTGNGDILIKQLSFWKAAVAKATTFTNWTLKSKKGLVLGKGTENAQTGNVVFSNLALTVMSGSDGDVRVYADVASNSSDNGKGVQMTIQQASDVVAVSKVTNQAVVPSNVFAVLGQVFTISVPVLVQLPDLAITKAPTYASGTIMFGWGNIGTADAVFKSGQAAYKIYGLDSKGNIVPGQTITPSLSGSSTVSLSPGIVLNAIFTQLQPTVATVKYKVVLDPDNMIVESNESNNTFIIDLPSIQPPIFVNGVGISKSSVKVGSNMILGKFSLSVPTAGVVSAVVEDVKVTGVVLVVKPTGNMITNWKIVDDYTGQKVGDLVSTSTLSFYFANLVMPVGKSKVFDIVGDTNNFSSSTLPNLNITLQGMSAVGSGSGKAALIYGLPVSIF